MLVSKAAMTNERSDANITVILHDNVAVGRPNINIPASELMTARRKINANMLASKAAITSRKSDKNKTPKKANASKAASNLY